jgi:hypothetical protein
MRLISDPLNEDGDNITRLLSKIIDPEKLRQ